MTDQEKMNALWKAHRAEAFLVFAAGGGLLVVDATRQPPRAWAARIDEGMLRVRTAGLPLDIPVIQPEIIFARLWSGDGVASRDLPPPEAAVLMGAVPGTQSWAMLSMKRFSEGLSASMRARLPVERMQAAEDTRMEQAGLGALKAVLDMEALGVLSACEDFGWKDYAYYAVKGEEGSLDANRRTVRHQAGRAYPMLASFIANRFGIKSDLDKQAKFMIARVPLKIALDTARAAGDVKAEGVARSAIEVLPKPPALLDSLERAFTPPPNIGETTSKPLVSKAALGRIGGVTLGPRGLRPEYLAMRMSELPPDWFPKKGGDWKVEEWDAFTDLVAVIGPLLGRLTGSRPETLYEGCGGKWGDLRDRIVRAFTDSRPPGGLQPEQVETLEASIDWKTIRALPRHKVEAAALEMADRIKGTFPPGLDAASVSDWIIRLVAPPRSREVIEHACNEAELAVGLLSSKILVPMAASVTGDADPMLNAEQFEQANIIASSILFGGKGAVKVFETMSEFHKNGAAIQSGGSLLPHENEGEDAKAYHAAALRERERKEQIKQAGVAASVGIDPNAPTDYPIPFAPVVVAPNGVHLCTLNTWPQFQDEGRGFRGDRFGAQDNRVPGTAYGYRHEEKNPDGSYGLNICVGLYRSSYERGKRGEFCISARLPFDVVGDGAPYTRLSLNSLTTFTNGPNGWSALVGEHKGQMNASPPELALEAFQWFFEGIKTGAVPHTLGDVEKQVNESATKLDRIEDICGYNWLETPRIGAALRPWVSVLPKRARLSYALFAELPEVQALADSLSPGWRQKAELREASWGRQSYATPTAPVP